MPSGFKRGYRALSLRMFPTAEPGFSSAITASNIDTALSLSNDHSWLDGGGGNIQSTRASWTAGTWFHVVGIYRDSGGTCTGELYINGVAEPLPANSSDNMAGGAQKIGIGNSDRFIKFNGLLDEVVIYDRALTAGEVQERYNSYAP